MPISDVDVRLRDLSQEEFSAAYSTDRFTAAVLSSRMRYIVEHMCSGLLSRAFSPILREWYDFAATISGPRELNYPMVAVSNSLALFLGTMAEGLRNTVEEYGPENLEPGDVVIANDPYRTGNHISDMCFVRPVFKGGAIVAYVTLRAHQLDMGGVIPGGFSATKQNVYEDGLVVPPTLLYRRDRPVQSTFNLIFDNCRFAEMLLPDIKAIYRNLILGERLLLESTERYGVPAFLGSCRYSCDVSAEAMADAVSENLPDGVFEAQQTVDADGLDSSLEYLVNVTVRKYGRNIEVDLSGTSEQARTSINCTELDAKTAVAIALKMLVDQHTPFTSGTYRNIDLVAPAGSMCNAIPPDGAVYMYWESSMPVALGIQRALSEAVGSGAVAGDYGTMMLHNGYGRRPDGSVWSSVVQCGGEHGPWGATKVADGENYTVTPLQNNIDPPTELIEADAPVVLLRKDYSIDSGGSGVHRGGAAVVKDTLWMTSGEHWSSPVRTKQTPGAGANGGGDGTGQACWMFEPEAYDISKEKDILPLDGGIHARSTPVAGMLDPKTKNLDPNGSYYYFAQTPVWRVEPNSTFRYQTSGGGGWGDPVERDIEQVRRDVRDEYISIEMAYHEYGVVVSGDPSGDPENLRVEYDATEELRASLVAGRSDRD